MDKVRIKNRFATKWKRNPISGHKWPEYVMLKGYEVSGGWFLTSTHMTLKNAEKEKALRESMNKKFPFVMPRSKREIAKAKRLGLNYP